MTDEKKKTEKKPLSLVSIIAAMTASVASMLLGSLFSDKGTIYGAALGAGTSSTVAVVVENHIRKAHARIRAMREQEKADAEPGHYLQARLKELPLGREALIRARQRRIMQRGRSSPLRFLGLGLGMALVCCLTAFLTLFGIEAATGKTVHSNFSGPAQYGTSFSYGTTLPAPSPSHVPSPSRSGSSSPSQSPSETSSPSPSPSPSVSSPSPSPSATVSSSSPTVAVPAGSPSLGGKK